MPQNTLSTSRRQHVSESESRAPFNSQLDSNDDPFNEDSTPYTTYSTGAGSVPVSSVSPRNSPSPSAGRSPESTGLGGHVPAAMACFTKRLTKRMPPLETASPPAKPIHVERRRSKSDGARSTAVAVAAAMPTSADGAGERSAVTPRGTGRSPRIGNTATPGTTTPRNPPPSRPGGLASAPTVPLRCGVTSLPVILTVPRGSAAAATAATATGPGRRRSTEVHEPFTDAQPSVAPKAGRTSGEPGTTASAAACVITSPLMNKPPTFVGNYARATARVSASSISSSSISVHTNDRDAPSCSQNSSTPCWVTDTSTSTPASREDEEHKTKEVKPPFFSVAPARGEYVALIEWLLRRGEQRDIGLPSATVSLMSSVHHNATTTTTTTTCPHTQQVAFFNEDYIAKLCAAATQVLSAEPGLLHLNVPASDTLVVVGDIHGQFQDLYTSVLCQQYDRRRCNPEGADRHFLFMGDYVDRGPHSLEVVLLLLALKVEYPSLVYLTRGNHEEEKTSRVYGFLTEATSSLGATVGAAVWSAVNKVFLDLPLAAIVTTPHMRFFVTHGGLSPTLHTVDEIAAVNRQRYSAGDITADQDDMVTGLLWSDPTTDVPMYRRNPRGCGFMFGPTASYNFCVENNVDFICRAHQVAMEGYIWTHNERVVTVFSAPNYCGVNGNKGAVMVVKGHTRRPILKQYDSTESVEEAPGPRRVFPYSAMFS